MAPVYSIRILEGPTSAGSEISLTVPAGHVYIVRDIDVTFINETNDGGMIAALLVNGGPISYWCAPGMARLAGQWRGRQVAQAGQDIATSTQGLAGEVTWRVSGYDLALP